jgi:hypothetical protein
MGETRSCRLCYRTWFAKSGFLGAVSLNPARYDNKEHAHSVRSRSSRCGIVRFLHRNLDL